MNLHSPLSIVCLWTVLFSVCLTNQSRLPAQDQENQPSAETEQAQKAEALKRAKQGQTYLKQKHWKKAISEFQAAVKLQPENSMLHYLLSVSYLEDSQGSLAWIEVRKAVLLDLKNQNAMQQFLKFWSFFDKQGVLNVGTPEVEVLKLLGPPDRKQEQGADTRLTYGFMWLTLRNASLFAVIDTRGLEAEYTKALQTMEFELGPDWRAAILDQVGRQRPLLGICVGMQWLFDGSEEAPGHAGLELLPGTCRLLTDETVVDERMDDSTSRVEGSAGMGRFKVPHVGWNSLHLTKQSWLLDGVDEGDQVYFTHSFAAPLTADCVGATRHGVEFAAAVERDHVGGVQFHPEKSSDVGLRILQNFLRKVS